MGEGGCFTDTNVVCCRRLFVVVVLVLLLFVFINDNYNNCYSRLICVASGVVLWCGGC